VETEGGEALPVQELWSREPVAAPAAGVPTDAPWFALWTHSNCEERVRDQLSGKGFRAFLPTVREWSRRAGVRRLIEKPMFPSYLFVQHAIEKRSYVAIMNTKGLVRILGERWDRLEAVPGAEIDAIHRVVDSNLPAVPYPLLREGQRVRIATGALAGLEGVLVRSRSNHRLLVLTVELLRRSVAVEVDCAAVEPV
jgi:transcription antitermination factor NusG